MRPVFFLLPVAVGASLALGACGQQSPKAEGPASQESAATSATAGQPKAGINHDFASQAAPDISWESSADGVTETLADIRRANPGQPILVNLWASWCAPCLTELPTLDALAARTQGRLVVVPISQDMGGWPQVESVFRRGAFPALHSRLDSPMQYGRSIGATVLPVSILYDAEGREVWRYIGDTDWTSTEAQSLLGLEDKS